MNISYLQHLIEIPNYVKLSKYPIAQLPLTHLTPSKLTNIILIFKFIAYFNELIYF